MDLVLLRTLLAVADAGTVTGAAERLSITQPALSRRLDSLEEYFGVELLERGRKGTTLTTLGEVVANEARVIAGRYDRLRAEVAAWTSLEGGTVRIGGGATVVSFILPEAIAVFQRAYPGVRFEVREAGSREVAEQVADGRLELGIVTLPVPDRELYVRPLIEDRIVAVCASRHPLAGRRRVAIGALSGLGLVGFESGSAIRQTIDGALRAAGIEMNVVMELRSIPAILRMVESTANLAFVSDLGVTQGSAVRVLRIRGLSIRRRLALVYRRGARLSPAAARFADRLVATRSGR